jgi:eukaryotic-like serine/threonine-protein kinase
VPSEAELATLWQTLAATSAAKAVASDFANTIRPPRPRHHGIATTPSLPRLSLAGTLGPRSHTDDAPVSSADFEVVGLLGEGGMGRVHLARQRVLDREVALKTIKDERVDSPAVDMLGAEAVVMGRVEHPNVVPIHMIGIDARGRLVLVMKRIEGVQWRALLRDAEHPHWAVLDVARSDRMAFHLDVLAQVANALHFAHSRGVVHRDVKPENVMIGTFGEVYLVDWGVALTDTTPKRSDDARDAKPWMEGIVGTPAYMSPEAASGEVERHGPLTDVYLLGATLHEILTGQPRHGGSTLPAVLLAAYESVPFGYPAEVPGDLAALANTATARDPAERIGSALAFRRALDTHRRHRGSIALTRTAAALFRDASAKMGSSDAAALDRMLVECRFGFVSALREWPQNLEARDGLSECLELLARRELERDNLGGARALIEELREASAASAGELSSLADALQLRLQARQADAERIAAAEHDRDLELGLRQRTWVFAGLVAVGVGITAWTFLVAWRGAASSFRHSHTIAFASVILAVYVAGVAVFRRTLLANAANRMIVAIFGLMFGTFLLHRLLAARLGASVVATLAIDQLVLGSILSAGGLAVPKLRALGVPWVVGAIVSALWPQSAVYTFGIASITTVAIVVVGWDRIMRGSIG